MRDDLLRSECERRRRLGRQRQRLVERVGVQRLRAAESRGQRLDGRSDDVVVGLLRRERHAGRLRVEPQLPRSRILRLEPLAHHARPDAAGRAELGNLLEEVAVRVEEEGDAGREDVDVEPGVDRVIHVLDAVAQRERQFLRRGRARFADVIPAHGDRVPARHVTSRRTQRRPSRAASTGAAGR